MENPDKKTHRWKWMMTGGTPIIMLSWCTFDVARPVELSGGCGRPYSKPCRIHVIHKEQLSRMFFVVDSL